MRCALLAGLMFRGHALLLVLLVRLVQQLFSLIDRLATLPLLRTATKSDSTASACDQAPAQADGHASAGNATDGPHRLWARLRLR